MCGFRPTQPPDQSPFLQDTRIRRLLEKFSCCFQCPPVHWKLLEQSSTNILASQIANGRAPSVRKHFQKVIQSFSPHLYRHALFKQFIFCRLKFRIFTQLSSPDSHQQDTKNQKCAVHLVQSIKSLLHDGKVGRFQFTGYSKKKLQILRQSGPFKCPTARACPIIPLQDRRPYPT